MCRARNIPDHRDTHEDPCCAQRCSWDRDYRVKVRGVQILFASLQELLQLSFKEEVTTSGLQWCVLGWLDPPEVSPLCLSLCYLIFLLAGNM